MKTKAELLVRKMKADPNIAWSEKGELKYKGETVIGSNVVDLVNDVLRKRKCFNPQGWETALTQTVDETAIGFGDEVCTNTRSCFL
jgi:hypothetical protein